MLEIAWRAWHSGLVMGDQSAQKKYLGPQVKPERTGFRDYHLSQRHRLYGVALPCFDLDLLMVELNRARAVGLLEYKMELAPPQYISHPSYQALIDLGNRASVPSFCVRYAQNFSWWTVVPLNGVAKQMIPERITVDEKTFVKFLYQLRGIDPPEAILRGLEASI